MVCYKNTLSFKNSSFHVKSKYKMIDIGFKTTSRRHACVVGSIFLEKKVFNLIKKGKIPKGDPLILAEISAINATKNVSDIVLLCHKININNIYIYNFLNYKKCSIDIYCIVCSDAKTGVEMECMTGVMGGLLTIYDLTKKMNSFSNIYGIKLLYKNGGENGLVLNLLTFMPLFVKKKFFSNDLILKNITIVIFIINNNVNNKKYKDFSGKVLFNYLKSNGANILDIIIVSNKNFDIFGCLFIFCKIYKPDIVIIISKIDLFNKDIIGNIVLNFCKKNFLRIGELLINKEFNLNKNTWLSYFLCYIYKKILIITFPNNLLNIFESTYLLKSLILYVIKIIRK